MKLCIGLIHEYKLSMSITELLWSYEWWEILAMLTYHPASLQEDRQEKPKRDSLTEFILGD